MCNSFIFIFTDVAVILQWDLSWVKADKDDTNVNLECVAAGSAGR